MRPPLPAAPRGHSLLGPAGEEADGTPQRSGLGPVNPKSAGSGKIATSFGIFIFSLNEKRKFQLWNPENSTGTEQNLPQPRAQRRSGATVQCRLCPWHPAPHTALLSSQNPQWQLCDAGTAAAALPKKGCGLCSVWPGMPIGKEFWKLLSPFPFYR